MSYGNSAIIFKNLPPKAPDVPVTGADNGLHVDTGLVKMGGPLIEETLIEASGFHWELGDVATSLFIDFVPANGIIGIGGTESTSGAQIEVLPLQQLILFGNWVGGVFFDALVFDMGAGEYSIGDQNTSIFLSAGEISFDNDNQIMTGSGFGFLVDNSTKILALGDWNFIENNFQMQIEDLHLLVWDGNGGNYFNIDVNQSFYQLGDLAGVANFNYIFLDDANSTFGFYQNTDAFLSLDILNGLYQIGDIDGSGFGAKIIVDDANRKITLNSGSQVLIWSSGLLSGLRAKLSAGAATLAPLQFQPGTNLTTPVDGTMEYDGTNLYFTVGTTRKIVTLT
jgi:hypothetical protein